MFTFFETWSFQASKNENDFVKCAEKIGIVIVRWGGKRDKSTFLIRRRYFVKRFQKLNYPESFFSFYFIVVEKRPAITHILQRSETHFKKLYLIQLPDVDQFTKTISLCL